MGEYIWVRLPNRVEIIDKILDLVFNGIKEITMDVDGNIINLRIRREDYELLRKYLGNLNIENA